MNKITDKEALEKCYYRIYQNDCIADDAYDSGNMGLYKIKSNENDWLDKVYRLAMIGYAVEQERQRVGKKERTEKSFFSKENIKDAWEKSKKEGLI